MNKISYLHTELEKFGLTQAQASIYLLLAEHKELRIQEIAQLAGMPRSSVYQNLKKLFELGIAEEVTQDNYKTIRPYPIGIIKHGLDEQISQLQQLQHDLDNLEQQLVLEPAANEAQTVVRYYSGRSGARQLYWNSLKAEGQCYVYSDWGRGRYVGMKFYERFVAESHLRGITEKVLINITPEALESIRVYNVPGSPISRTRLADIRVIDPGLMTIKGDTLMYDAVYAQVYLKHIKIDGFEIENARFAESQRSIFETFWHMARPVTEFL